MRAGGGEQARPRAAVTRVPGLRAESLAPTNKGSLSARGSFATPSKWKGMRGSSEGSPIDFPFSLRHFSGRPRMIVVGVGEGLLVSLLVRLLSKLICSGGIFWGRLVRMVRVPIDGWKERSFCDVMCAFGLCSCFQRNGEHAGALLFVKPELVGVSVAG